MTISEFQSFTSNGKKEQIDVRRSLIATLTLGLFAGSTQAALIADDFESDTVGSAPAGWTILPVGPPAPDTFTVQSSAQSPIGAAGDNKGMRLLNDHDVQYERMNRNFTAQTGTFYVQFDYLGVNLADLHNLQIGDNNNYGISTPGRGVHLTMSTTSGVAVDTWYRFTLTINVATDTYDWRVQTLESTSVDSTTTGVGFTQPQGDLDSIRFWFNTGNFAGAGDYYLDNILVTDDPNDLNFAVIPEPSSLALTALGISGSLTWRRRRRC